MTGTLAATATTGDITDSDTLTVSGASVFTLGADGSNISLDSAANAFSGAVTLKAGPSEARPLEILFL